MFIQCNHQLSQISIQTEAGAANCTTLKLSVLKSKIKTKPHVKPRGRPKHTGTLWPSRAKRKGPQKRLHLSDDDSKENLPPEKKSRNGMRLAGIPAYRTYKRRLKHRLESPASESVRVIDVEATDVPVPDSEPVVITV